MTRTFIWPETPTYFGQEYIVAVTALTMLIAAPGNLLTALIIVRNEALRSEPAYLLICSVCFADTIVATVTQPLFAVTILLGSRYSSVVDHAYFTCAWLSSVSSTLGIIMITFDRYAYIVHPLHYQSLMTVERARFMMCAVWVVAILFGTLPLLYHNSLILHTAVLGIMVVISLFMAYTYCRVYRQVSQAADQQPPALQSSQTNSQKGRVKRQNQATKTVLLVVMAFFGCWFPWVVVSFVISLHESIPQLEPYRSESYLIKLHWIFLGMGYCNSSLNVFIYSRKNTVLQRAISKYFIHKRIPIISRLFAGRTEKKKLEKETSIRYNTRAAPSTCLNTNNNNTTKTGSPCIAVVGLKTELFKTDETIGINTSNDDDRFRSQTLISVLSFQG